MVGVISAQPTLRHSLYRTILLHAHAHVAPFIVGPAGCGKTTLAMQVADEMGLEFYSTGAVESSYALRGFHTAHGDTVHTLFRKAYENGGLFLFDEVDASAPEALVSVHAALDNGFLDAPDGMIKRHPNFVFMAAGNTWGHGRTPEYVGRNALDAATLDRYSMIAMDYDPLLEDAIAGIHHAPLPIAPVVKRDVPQEEKIAWLRMVQQARKSCRDLGLRHIVSKRPIVNGLKLLEYGMPAGEAFCYQVIKGLPEADAIKLKNAMEREIGRLPTWKITSANTILTGIERLAEEFSKAERDVSSIRRRAEINNGTVSAQVRLGKELLEEMDGSIAKLNRTLEIMEGITRMAPAVLTTASHVMEAIGATKFGPN